MICKMKTRIDWLFWAVRFVCPCVGMVESTDRSREKRERERKRKEKDKHDEEWTVDDGTVEDDSDDVTQVRVHVHVRVHAQR